MEVASVVSEYIPDFIYSIFENVDDHPWICAAIASVMVGLSGILPLLIIPVDESATFKDGPGATTLRILLSFAVGGLLGDVFLHLLPEAWAYDIANTKEGEHVSMRCGLWCLCGMLAFIVVEKLFAPEDDDHQESQDVKPYTNGINKQVEIEEIDKLLEKERQHRGKGGKSTKVEGGAKLPVGELTAKQIYESCVFNNNSPGDGSCCGAVSGESGTCGRGRWIGRCLLREARDNTPHTQKKHVSGYLNLMANSVDNFTHGLAVGGSFLVGARVGLLTTFAILVHEIPHEVGDFAILLKSGFTRWEAAKAQLATAAAGLVGAMTAVIFSGANTALEAKTSWIGPFTAGGFLHIALVTVLPELVKETPRDSLLHLLALLAGLGTMAAMTHYFH